MCAFVRPFPVWALHPSTCMRSEPVNDGLWTYEGVDGRYLRKQAARVEWAPRGMAVVFPPKGSAVNGILLCLILSYLGRYVFILEENI